MSEVRGSGADEGRRRLRPSRLGSWSGVGLVTVARAADGTAYDVNGTWRPDERALDVDALRQAFPPGTTVRYEGAVFDPADRSEASRSFDVIVTSLGEYEDHAGDPVHLVNFDVPGIS